jgi:hypothetical protein
MGVALFITLEKMLPGIDALSVSGNFLAKNLEWLDEAAKNSGVQKLSELISINPEEAGDFLEGEGVSDLPDLPAEQWFEAEDGLRTIEVLLQQVESQKANDSRLLDDLRSCRQVLDLAKQGKVRFHFSIDF